MPKHRLSRRRRIAAAATAIAAGGVLIVAQNDAPAASADPVGLNAAYEYLGWGDAPDPVAVMKATGLKQFTLAFLLAGQGCDPRWDGQRPLTGGDDEAKIRAIRAAGGEVVASFGGWDGAKLGEKCTDSTQLAAAYQKVIDAYQLKAIDIDMEATELASADARQRVAEALGVVKAKNPGLRVYVTFSAELDGPDASGADLIARAAKARVEVDGWTVMPFDFDSHPGTMVDATVSALGGLQQTLVRAYGYDADTAWRHTGLSSMNGHSDSKDEVVSPADFSAMRDFAAAHHLARFTYWAVNRDRSCSGAFTKESASVCDGIPQDPYAFTKIVAGYHVDSAPSGPVGGSTCPGPKPSTGVSTTAQPADDGESPAPGASPSPAATRLQARRAATRIPATPGESPTPGGSAAPTADASDRPSASPTASPTPSRTGHGTPGPATTSAAPTGQGATTTRTASAPGGPKSGATPTADCTSPAAPAPGPTGTGSGTAQPSQTPSQVPGQTPSQTPSQNPGQTPAQSPSQVPTASPTPEPNAAGTADDPEPTDETTTVIPAPAAPVTQPPARTGAAVAAGPAATADPDTRTGQALAHTGGGDATGVLMEGAGALLLLGGGFGMVGTRRRREAERVR
ncbi:hypothetical protein AB0O91_11780 [Kitasatospora sp. NPDC089797]|uniref:chitinase n=1 Tax=Kitasatospora sp. NPDC089797 TaxID=3155298 RepID=UPI003414B425